QGSLQIDDSENEINDNNESSEIQAKNNTLFSDHQEQSDDSLPQEKNNNPLCINRLVRNFDEGYNNYFYIYNQKKYLKKSKKRKRKAPLNISCKKKEKTQIQYTSSSDSSKADSNTEDKLTSSDTNNIVEVQIANFSHLFNDTNGVQFSQLKYTKLEVEENMLKLLYELRGAYLALLVILAKENKRDKNKTSTYKALHGLVKKKVKLILRISERHEQRYWVGTWRLIELLNITHCPASILVELGLTARYLMRNANYDQFLQSLLNNVEANHEAPKFSESLIL
ncbi:12240_t:CDS:2, partial [Gigaspora margarita]